MPKSYTVGNGSLLAGFDEYARIRDLYFPYVGQENHVGDQLRHRIAVRVDGKTHFLSDDFSVQTVCSADTLAGQAKATNQDIGITVHFKDIVYNEQDVLIRSVEIENSRDEPRDIKIYFCQEFQIAQTTQANTAYYDPRRDVVVHYRGQRAFLVNASDNSGSFNDYTTGVFGIAGRSGSYVNAYDGDLPQNPIEHGPCDSCISMRCTVPANDRHNLHYWVAAGTSIPDIFRLDQTVLEKTPEHIVKSTTDFWNAWVDRRDFRFNRLSDEMKSLFRQSLLTIRSHVSKNGAIIASSDSDMLQKGKDTYSYVWPRDGTYIAEALDIVGDWNIAQKFFRFAESVLSPNGYFMHKFNPDKSLGSSWHPWIQDGEPQLPIQEDETGVVLHELWDHYERSRDLEFIENTYDSLIRPAAEFMLAYRNQKTNLPKPSYDLWEETYGVHTYTAASVYGGLISAAKIAQLLGKTGDGRKFERAAESIKEAILKHLLVDGIFVKGRSKPTAQSDVNHTPDMSTVYGLLKFDVLPVTDERLQETSEHIFAETTVDTNIGGYARYAGDQYYRDSEHSDVPGNPWFIATLWHARFVIADANTEADLQSARENFEWVQRHARGSGVLSEQVDPHDGSQISAAPLIWSHAEYIKAIQAYENKLQELTE